MRKLARAYVVGGLTVATAALSGCSSSSSQAQRDDSSGEITASADADVFSIKVGDCLDLASTATSDEVSSLPTVPCVDEHDSEVYAETALSGDVYPADVQTQAETFCTEQFSDFVGLSYDESSLNIQYLTPTEDTWDYQDDRTVQCILVSGERVTGTLKGSAL